MCYCSMQVYAANDIVYEDVAAGFSQLCSSLLPSLELQLVRTGSQAHEGLQFRWVGCQLVGCQGRARQDTFTHTAMASLSPRSWAPDTSG